MKCRLCNSNRLTSILDLGATPPCERFLTSDELDSPECTYPLHLRLCEDCLLLQIPALITPEDTFTEYAYFSSYSQSWVEHAGRFVHDALESGRLSIDSKIVEVASNDGYLLRHRLPRHRTLDQRRRRRTGGRGSYVDRVPRRRPCRGGPP
jgi:hypothetical protein